MDFSIKEKERFIKESSSIPFEYKAAQFSGPGKINVIETTMTELGEKEVVVALEGCGLCTSNIPPFEGRDWFDYPFEPGAPGHEGWGIVKAVGNQVSKFKEGDRVAMLSYHAFAQFDKAHEDSVVQLPPSFNDKPFPGEPLGCAMNIYTRSDIEPGQKVAVIGIGFLGALLIQLLKEAGAEVIAISRRDFALETAEKFKADHLIKLDDHWKIVDQVKKITNQKSCDRVIEATGKQWPLDLAGDLIGEGGKMIIAGFHQDGLRKVNMQTWNWKGIDVINAHERKQEKYISGIKEAVLAVENGILNPFPLFTHQFPLNEIKKAFKISTERPEGFLKALIINKYNK